MKQQRLSLSLPFLIGFCALAFQFPSELLGAEETPMPSATPAATGTAGISPTPSQTPVPPSVRRVGVHNWTEQLHVNQTYAQRGDQIWVDIINFKDWVNSLEKKPDNHEINDLILYLDHFPLLGVSPIYSYDWIPNQWTGKGKDGSLPVEYNVTTVGFFARPQ